jgi:hypothetical protein
MKDEIDEFLDEINHDRMANGRIMRKRIERSRPPSDRRITAEIID